MGPCLWPIILPECAGWEPNPDPGSAQDLWQRSAEAAAKFILWARTGRIFGVCTVTVRPCFRAPRDVSTYRGHAAAGPTITPGIISGSWRDGPCGCSGGCGCTVGAAEVALPGPIADVLSVVIDGQPLPATAYRIRNRRWLLRVDGKPWPQDQDLTAPDDGVGAWTVTYRRGVPVPLDGQRAAGLLACEFLTGMRGGACAISERAVSIARQGVSIQLGDLAAAMEGSTGLPSVDAWIAAVNPGRARSPSRVYNPDTMVQANRIR